MSEQLKYKMLKHEATPPPGAWDSIATTLEETNQILPIAQKLYTYESAPPATAWNNISAGLEIQPFIKKQTPVKNIQQRFYRMTAAVAAIIAVLFAGYYLYNNNTVKLEATVLPSITPPPQPPIDNQTQLRQNIVSPPLVAVQQLGTSTAPFNNTIIVYNAKNDNRILRYARIQTAPSLSQEQHIVVRATPIRNKSGEIIYDDAPAPNTSNHSYLSITAPNGQQTKISSKFSSVIRFINSDTDNNLDNNTWKKKFQEWRTKIVQSAFIPSSNNFLDIIELSELLKEN